MKDLNFFELYIEKKEFKIDKKLIYFGTSCFVVLALLTYTIYNSILIKQETRIVQSLKETVENPRTVEKVEEIKAREVEVNQFRESVEKIKQLDKTIEGRDIIYEGFLEEITSKMPTDLFLTSLSIQNNDIQIIGISKDKWSIAEFEKGLEDIENFEETFVSNISLQEDYYNFTINITLKDVGVNGEESMEEKENQN